MYTKELPLDFFNDTIDVGQLCDTDPEFCNYFVKNPLQYENIIFNKIFTNIPACLLIPASLTKKHYNSFVRVEGTIIKVGPVLYKNIQEMLYCLDCKIENIKVKNKKTTCVGCSGSNFEKRQNFENIKTYQRVKIQDVSNKGPLRTVEVIFESRSRENTKKIIPGDKVIVSGIVMLNLINENLRTNEQLRYNYCIKALDMEVIQQEEINDSDDLFGKYCDKNMIEKRNFILKMFCSEIYGLNHVKLGLILALLGKSEDSNRLNSHILLVGDPGLGKTTLLRFCLDIITPSRFINGLSTSEVGLTACAVKTEKDWGLEAGALVVTDGGICCIDNFNDLNVNEKGGLLEAMEQQTISIAKAGMNVKFQARCTILAASGYKKQRDYLSGFDLKNNVNISTPLLSRFDLIFGIFEKTNLSFDEKVCDLILRNKNTEKEQKEIRILINSLRNKEVKISVPEDIKNLIFNYYQHKKRMEKENDEYNTIRMIEGLLRLAQGHARLVLNEEITENDCFVAIFLNECSLKSKKIVKFDEEIIFTDDEYFKMIKNEYLEKIG